MTEDSIALARLKHRLGQKRRELETFAPTDIGHIAASLAAVRELRDAIENIEAALNPKVGDRWEFEKYVGQSYVEARVLEIEDDGRIKWIEVEGNEAYYYTTGVPVDATLVEAKPR